MRTLGVESAGMVHRGMLGAPNPRKPRCDRFVTYHGGTPVTGRIARPTEVSMKRSITRTGVALASVAAVAVFSLAACSSGSSDPASDAATPTLSASDSAAPTDSAQPSDSAPATDSAAPVDAAGAACEAYFKVDLLNSQYAGGAVKQGDMTEADARSEMAADLFTMNKQAKAAAADGSGSAKLAKNALLMKRLIKALKAGAPLSALSKKDQQNFATYSLRVQKACDALGYPLPDENVTARSTAGIKQ